MNSLTNKATNFELKLFLVRTAPVDRPLIFWKHQSMGGTDRTLATAVLTPHQTDSLPSLCYSL